jgi:hypothetical protein
VLSRTTQRWVRYVALACAAWVAALVLLVAASWVRANGPESPVAPVVYRLDLRTDPAIPGRTVDIVAKTASPTGGDYVGHIWIGWPETPAGARPGSRAAGYYADDQLQAVAGLAGALVAPWGVLTGQNAVPGRMRADDGLPGETILRIEVEEAAYQRALAVDAAWRQETRYVLRPGVRGVGPGRTFACQDYAFEVAQALGLRRPTSFWGNFPATHFRNLLRANAIDPP